MFIKAFLQVISYVTIVLFLIGCGFQLQSKITMPKHLQTLKLATAEPYEPFQKALRHTLEKHHVAIAQGGHLPELSVSRPEVNEKILALGPSGQAQRISISYAITYQLKHPLTTHTDSRTITKSREFSGNANTILKTNQERQTIESELRQEVLYELLYHLSHAQVTEIPHK